MAVRPGTRRQTIIVRLRHCKICRKAKPEGDFYTKPQKGRQRPDHRCKSCSNKLRYGWQRAQYRRDPVARERRLAREAVRRAVKHGKLKKPSACQGCKVPFAAAELHGHHANGYRNRLNVIFVCRPCHHAAHGAMRKVVGQ